MSTLMTHFKRLSALLVFGSLACAQAMAANPPNDPPDLGATPPDLTVSVDPNFVFTFDDSGSMAWTHMGDFRPYDSSATSNSSWNGPYRCANVIDPRITADTDAKSRGMNGVYYNPNITYTPPLKEDGTAFPNADATLTAVWNDGVAVNRPVSPATTSAAGFNNNLDGVAASNSGGVTNLMGTYYKQTGSAATCGSVPNCTCSGSGSSRVCSADNRFECGTGSVSDGAWTAARATQNPFDGNTADPDTGAKPNGGPVYYRLKSSVTFVAGTDLGTLGQFTATGVAKLYNAANWEAVAVPPSQYQNFANWFAYYRYRNLMARTSISRVFGVIGTPNSANIRVAWQNLNNSTYLLPASTIITNLDDNSTDPTTGKPYRQAFFNWIYQIPAQNSTPSRSAEIRAGEFFRRGNTGDLKDPYWSPGSGGQPGLELACRQNFHLLMTDGLYNQPAVSVSGNASATSAAATLGPAPPTAPAADPTTYAVGSGVSPTSLFNHPGWTLDSDGGSSYSDIAFYYWANNLRPDLKTSHPNDIVPSYYPDQTTGVTGPVTVVDPTDPGAVPEVFWNPLNDPATWPHVVQFAVTLGAFGNLDISDDVDCNKDDGFGVGNDDMCKLRKGQTTSTGSIGWPRPNGTGSGIAANIDDLWHAALNSRGAFFVATNPNSLVQHISDVINNILSRSQTSTSNAVSSNISSQTNSVYAFSGGYDSGNWSGFLYKEVLAANGAASSVIWDAGCILTGGTFTPVAASPSQPPHGICTVPTPAPAPPTRVIFTSVNNGGTLSGKPFEWASLGAAEQAALNLDPNTTNPDPITGQVTGTSDGNGTDRVDYLRGKRINETTPTLEAIPRQFRARKSLLGPIVNSTTNYEAGPQTGVLDQFPAGTPEEIAARPCLGAGGTSAPGCGSYEKFVQLYGNRTPVVYVGSNDGMLHAFDAGTGVEQWAYVPNMLYGNGQLLQVTNPASTIVPTVDDSPIHSDVFFGGTWHTILVGGGRLGARGVYALDITDQSAPGSEGTAAGKFLWEFSSRNDADLGYTYASTNTARLPNGKWVVLLTSGYFPQKLQVRSATYGVNQTPDNAPAATANITHLWVLDAQTGAVIRKFNTTSGITSYGLSTPASVSLGGTLIEDTAVAGDLAGNLWRFDLSSTDPNQWTVENMFRTYTSTLPCSATNTSGVGCEPITVQPIGFRDSLGASNGVYVFGSGEYLGPTDRTASSVLGTNHFFGVRDFGTGSPRYPMHESDLVSQTLTQNAAGARFITASPLPASAGGWMIPLNVSGVQGERDVATVYPLYTDGAAVLVSLIPGANNDPCTPGRTGAAMFVDASSGGKVGSSSSNGGGFGSAVAIGAEVLNPPSTGGIQVLEKMGGGYLIPGLGVIGSSNAANGAVDVGFGTIWRRTSWRELLNDL